MKLDPIVRLKNYLDNPLSPAWSSQGLIDMFKDLDGSMKEKQQIILPIIDKSFARIDCEMTSTQYHFMRAVTLFAVYSETRVEFSELDLKWLLDKFDDKPTPQRAALITMLLNLKSKAFSKDRKQKIKKRLLGTLAEQNWDE